VGLEIERKFLVRDGGFLRELHGERLLQGYVAHSARATVRVRIAGERAWLTLKGETRGISRSEFEYPIPPEDAAALLAELCDGGLIDKTRYRVVHGAHVWDVDVFAGANAGLLLAEVELGREDEAFARPPWLGEEVSGDPRYFNSSLAERPYASW
jgi:CYTH domain-containing protein